MRYCKAEPGDRKAMQALWMTCFSDREEETALYFDTYGTGNAFVAREGKVPLAMVLYFPTELFSADGECLPCAYLYCFCTHPDARGRSIGRELLRYAEGELKTQGFACTALVPGEKSLFDYYQRCGYVTAFSCTRQTVSAGKSEAAVKPASANRYLQLRQMLLWENCVMNPEQDIAFCKSLCRLNGGDLIEIAGNDSIGCAVVWRCGDELRICDLLSEAPAQAAMAILEHFSAEKATVLSPGTEPYGMVKWLLEPRPLENAYLGLAFG